MAEGYSDTLSELAASSDFMQRNFNSDDTVCSDSQHSTRSRNLRSSDVIEESSTDDMIEKILNLQSVITACELPDELKKKMRALRTMDPTLDVSVSETGKISIKYDSNKTRVIFRDLCYLVYQIPRELFTIKMTRDTYEKLGKKQKDEVGCLIRYRRHVLKGPYYVKCWIHRGLVIILSYGDKSNTNCEALLKWIRPTLKNSKTDKRGQKDETEKEMANDDTEPMDTNNRNYKTIMYVESNEKEVKEIPRHVCEKMDARKFQSVCVPLEGPETDLITQFVQYFSKKAKERNSIQRLFLEMCICVESEEDTRFCETKSTLEKTIDRKMFKCLKLSGLGLEDKCHDSLSPIEVEIDTDYMDRVAEKVDVLVNSSSPSLDLAKGFVEKQILELGGKTIQDECKEEKKRGTFTYGKVCKTTAGQLQCRKIYHIALYEEWISKCKLSLEILAASVVECLSELEKDGFKSIAFPALGTGMLGYPYCPVANTMVTVVHAYGKKNPDTKIERVHFFLHPDHKACQTSFRIATKLNEVFLQSNPEDFIERPYKQLWLSKENMTVQIWPELAPSCTSGRNQIEAYYVFVQGNMNDADRRRLCNFGGFVSTFPDWDEKKEEVKDQVLRHGLSAVSVDIKDAKVRDCVAYQEDIIKCFEQIPCIELLKIVVSNDMFQKLNSKNSEINIHRVSKIDVSVWGNRCKEVSRDVKSLFEQNM